MLHQASINTMNPGLAQNEPSDIIRKKLKKIRRKLIVRWILRHFGL